MSYRADSGAPLATPNRVSRWGSVTVRDGDYTVSPGTDRLKADILAWRETRARVGPMPAPLWKRAVRLATVHGACSVAKAIGVDYCGLRGQMEALPAGTADPAFLEIPAAVMLAASAGVADDLAADWRPSETQVELFRTDGSQLRMRGPALDAAAIVAAFMGRR